MRTIEVYKLKRLTSLPVNCIFVFGSNRAGHHGAGAAKDAVNFFGAIYGHARGVQGQSYAIPTKDENIKTLSLPCIEREVNTFIDHAKKHSQELFLITPIGTGLAGYKDSQIAPMFSLAPLNCILPIDWLRYFANTAALSNYS